MASDECDHLSGNSCGEVMKMTDEETSLILTYAKTSTYM